MGSGECDDFLVKKNHSFEKIILNLVYGDFYLTPNLISINDFDEEVMS